MNTTSFSPTGFTLITLHKMDMKNQRPPSDLPNSTWLPNKSDYKNNLIILTYFLIDLFSCTIMIIALFYVWYPLGIEKKKRKVISAVYDIPSVNNLEYYGLEHLNLCGTTKNLFQPNDSISSPHSVPSSPRPSAPPQPPTLPKTPTTTTTTTTTATPTIPKRRIKRFTHTVGKTKKTTSKISSTD
uniref:Uncharacterized protein n=1 Tax=Trichobilharzia regenti TaxID=157069 RepID=A0AA85IXB6_TRIRE|nr:unnamed protein product [Trichobilharzia regenti]